MFSIDAIIQVMKRDYGKEYGVRGYVKGFSSLFMKGDFYEEDMCENEKVLIEYYCVSDDGINYYKKSVRHDCIHGCKSGECLEG